MMVPCLYSSCHAVLIVISIGVGLAIVCRLIPASTSLASGCVTTVALRLNLASLQSDIMCDPSLLHSVSSIFVRECACAFL